MWEGNIYYVVDVIGILEILIVKLKYFFVLDNYEGSFLFIDWKCYIFILGVFFWSFLMVIWLN